MGLTARDVEWAAGFLEGEGHFTHTGASASVNAAQVQRWPLDKCQRLFGGSICLSPGNKGVPNSQPYHRWDLSGLAGAGLMMTLYSAMSPKRQAEIKKVLSFWRSRPVCWKYQTQCQRGHEFTRIVSSGRSRRACLVCQKAAHSRKRRERRLAIQETR